jgi:pilus assembly protein CpaE
MSPHSSGVRVLAAPSTPEMSETISPDDIKNILSLLRRDFDYILLDTWSYLDDNVLAAMDLADRVLIVMTPEIPSVRSTKQFLEIAEALQFPLDHVDLILNKLIPRDGIRPDQIERSMKHKILAQLDFAPRGVRQATNQGLPLIMADPNHALSLGFRALAEQTVAALAPEPAQAPEEEAAGPSQERKRRTGLFGRLRK